LDGAVTWLLGRSVTRPTQALIAVTERLAAGDRSAGITGVDRRDELGTLAKAVQVFKDNLIRADELVVQEQAKLVAATAQKVAMGKTADAFEAKISGLVSMLSSGATELQATAQTMSSTATQTNQLSIGVESWLIRNFGAGHRNGERPIAHSMNTVEFMWSRAQASSAPRACRPRRRSGAAHP